MRKKEIAFIILVVLLSASLGIIHFQREAGLSEVHASLSAPMYGQSPFGPYYITAECKIIGPEPEDRVSLADIAAKVGGTLYPGYVEWGGTYRIYIDNTFQRIIWGEFATVSCWIEYNFLFDNGFISYFNHLVNTGAIPTGFTLSGPSVSRSSSLVGHWIIFSFGTGTWEFSITTNDFRSLRFGSDYRYDNNVYINDINFGNADQYQQIEGAYRYYSIRHDVPSSGTTNIRVQVKYGSARLCLYTGGIESISGATPTVEYEFSKWPGTGIALKELWPKTIFPGDTIMVTVYADPPTADDVSISDAFPDVFSMIGPVTIDVYSGNIGVNGVTQSFPLTPEDGNLRFDTGVLFSSLDYDRWLIIRYELQGPATTGTYTFPAAQINYLASFG